MHSSTVSVPAAAKAASGPAADPPALRAQARQGVWRMVAGGCLLGTLGVFVQEAGQDPLTTVWFRCLFGALALLAWGLARGRLGELRLRGRQWGIVLGSSALMILNWALFFAAIERTAIGVATVVFHVQPLWVMALGAWLLRERVAPRQWAVGLAALAGLVLATGLVDGARLGAWEDPSRYAVGVLMCLGGSLSYAGVTLLAKGAADPLLVRLHGAGRSEPAQPVSPFAFASWQCMVGALALAWWPLWQGLPRGLAPWAWLAGLGALHTGLAYVLLYAGMARLPAARIAMLQFVYPAAAILVDWAVYGHALTAIQGAGVAIMAAALWGVRRPATS